MSLIWGKLGAGEIKHYWLNTGGSSEYLHGRRTKSAYGKFDDAVKLQYAQNRYILKWWSPDHDQLLVEQIEAEQWNWYWGITDAIVSITPNETIETWRNEDPICGTYAWYNVLMYFAGARARKLGFTKCIREPKWKTCPLCNQEFVEDSLPDPLIRRLGIGGLDFCSPCLSTRVFQGTGNDSLSKEEILKYLQDLTEILQRVPPQDFGEGMDDFLGLNLEDRVTILRLLGDKPTLRRVKELFGSWLKALIEAGVLEDGTRRTSRGIQSIAKDGHVCLSLGEKTIDDFLYSHRILHEKEPPYPEGNFRADFLVNGVFIEYFGLSGNPEYDKKTKHKQRLCKKHGIDLISIYPQELLSLKNLEKKLSRVMT